MKKQKVYTSFLAGMIAVGLCFPVWAKQAPTSRPIKKALPTQVKKAKKNPHTPPKGYKEPKAEQLTFIGVNGEAYYSPKADKLVFQSHSRPSHSQTQIYVLDLKTKKERRINFHNGDDTCSYFHPTRKTILYASTVDEVKESHRFRHYNPKFLARMKALAEKRAKKSGKKRRRRYKWMYKPYEIYEVDFSGKKRRRLTHAPGYDAEGTYSPDGKKVIFSSHRDGDQELYIMNSDGTGQRRLTWRRGNDGGAFISPNNKQVTWRSFDKRGNAQVMVADLVNDQLKNFRQLTFRKGINWAPFWHPSGKWIMFSSNRDQRGNFELYLIDTKGTCLKRMTYHPASDVLSVFSPDGKTVVFVSKRVGNKSQVFRMPFVIPPGCVDPKQFKTPARLLHFGKKPSHGHGHGGYHRYKRYRRYKHKRSYRGYRHHYKKGYKRSYKGHHHKGHKRSYKGHHYKKGAHKGHHRHYGHHHRYKGKSKKPKKATMWGQLVRDLYFLSHPILEGRDAGTRGIKIAADYIAHQFKTFGLKPGVKGKSFFQPFETTVGVVLGKKNALAFTQGKAKTKWVVNNTFAPFSFSSNGTVSSSVVFAGYGITAEKGYDDYKGIDVKGKIVLLFRYSPRWHMQKTPFGKRRSLYSSFRYKLLNARTHGAKGVLVVDPPFPKEKKVPALSKLRMARGLSDAGLPALHIRRDVAKVLLKGSGQTLKGLWEKIAKSFKPQSLALKDQLTMSAELKRKSAKIDNVIGIIPGTDAALKKEAIVIGAHYDHLGHGGAGSFPGNHGKIHPGADDNASGTAGMMALARYFAKHPVKRTLIFIAFAGEERGLLGSAHYVRHPSFAIKQTVAMLNYDMIGRMRNNKFVIQGAGTSPRFLPMLKKLVRTSRFNIRLGASGYGPSDHTSFYSKKIPVLFMFTGAHTDYHRPSDTFDRLNIKGIHSIVKLSLGVIKELAANPKRPAYRHVMRPKKQRRIRGGMRAYLGTIPDYGGKKIKGVALTGVRPQGPAYKAGIRGGDIIVKIGKYPIDNLYDMVIALKHYQPFQKVVIEVLRKGKRLKLNATLGMRGSGKR